MLNLTKQDHRLLKKIIASVEAPDKLRGDLIRLAPTIYYIAKKQAETLGVKYSKLIYDELYSSGICKTCGKEPVFISMFQGYKQFCSNYCLGTNSEIQTQKRESCRATTGHDYPMQSKRVRTKSRKAVQKRYGVDNVSQAKEVQDSKVATFYKRYGYSNSSKHPDIKRKIGRLVASSLSRKKVVNGQGKQYILQGYEPQALVYMKRFFKYKDIHGQSSGKVPSFEYFDGRPRVYFPDFLVESQNCIVEVKSSYTFCSTEARYRTNRAKAKAVKAAGYGFKLLIMQSDGSKIKIPPDWCSLSFRAMQECLVQQGCRL